jgi:hypothetical protein
MTAIKMTPRVRAVNLSNEAVFKARQTNTLRRMTVSNVLRNLFSRMIISDGRDAASPEDEKGFR